MARSAELTDKILKKMKEDANGGAPKLFFKLTKKTEMNVYLYGGTSRNNATERVVDGNGQAELNKEYELSLDSGLFIVAFPNLDKETTELAFNYWVEAKKVPKLVPWHQFEGEQGETIFMLICLLALIQLLCITCVCCYYCCKSRQLKKQIGVEREKLDEQELEI